MLVRFTTKHLGQRPVESVGDSVQLVNC